ncbi:MAG: hypothetical protein ACM3XO_25325 [Bacteroidota bacterium]
MTPESKLQIGDKPTKKNTGELNPLLPDWLQELQKQAKDSAEKDAADAAGMPKVEKAGPPDLLAGLASQSANVEDDDVPDWLKSLSPKAEQKPAPAPAAPTSDKEMLAAKPQPQSPQPPPGPSGGDELSEWFSQASEQPAEPFTAESDAQPLDLGWDFQEDVPSPASRKPSREPEEDLSWLHNLEAEAKKTGELASPKKSDDWSSVLQPPAGADASGQDDLSWLDDLGSLPTVEPSKPEPAVPGEDLSWLNAFADTPQAPSPASHPVEQDDLSWLNDLGSLPPSTQPAPDARQAGEDLGWLSAFSETPAAPHPQDVPAAPASSQEDLGWLSALDDVSMPSQPAGPKKEEASSEEDLGWLRNLPGSPAQFTDVPAASAAQKPSEETPAPPELPKVSPFTPRHTAPLGEGADTSIPEWLKSATEEPSLPLGTQALDQMREDKSTGGWAAGLAAASIFGSTDQPADETPAPSEPALAAGEAAALFNQDVDAIFSQEMPDWLAQTKPVPGEPAEEGGIHAESGETLTPAELPSWVQAMRPVEAMIAEAGPRLEDQPVERQGPLAGLKGVIPIAVIGSLRRPHPIPLTLQASAEQQASAGILEQILIAETTPRPVVSTPAMASQRNLRWVIAGLLLFVLAAVIVSGTQIMPVSPVLPAAASNITNVILNVASNAPVLVIMDYQPSLAGEMEAISGPVLDQLVQLRHPYLSFVSTSPSGNALVERLLKNTNISQPDGTGYIAEQNYQNLGYLPGGESGVLAFLQSPPAAIPASRISQFSEYAAILLLTDQAESARTWVEQIDTMKQSDPALAGQPLLAVSSAQTGPMLQPYVSSGQINGLLSGLPVAARYELLNNNRPGTIRSYWDAFGVGMMMAVMLIVLGSLWSVYSGYRARSAGTVKE